MLPYAFSFSEAIRRQITGNKDTTQSYGQPHPAVRIYSPTVDGEVTYAVEVSWDGAVFVFGLVKERPSPELLVATIDDAGEGAA